MRLGQKISPSHLVGFLVPLSLKYCFILTLVPGIDVVSMRHLKFHVLNKDYLYDNVLTWFNCLTSIQATRPESPTVQPILKPRPFLLLLHGQISHKLMESHPACQMGP